MNSDAVVAAMNTEVVVNETVADVSTVAATVANDNRPVFFFVAGERERERERESFVASLIGL